MRLLDWRSLIVIQVGVVATVVGMWLIIGGWLSDRLSDSSDFWVFAVVGVVAVLGPVLILIGVLGLTMSAALADRHEDELAVLNEEHRLRKLS